MSSFEKTCVFVCTDKSGCGGCGSKKLVKEFKKLLRQSDEDLSQHYKVIESGCLGRCSKGIVAVAFPENLVFTKLSKKSASYVLADLEETRKLRLVFESSKSSKLKLEEMITAPLSH